MISYKNFQIDEYDELDSTNKFAISQASKNLINQNHIIIAKKQTSGRGRFERVWESPSGNLYFSLVLRPKVAFKNIYQLSFLSVVALRLALEKIAKNQTLQIKNKWPNDLLIAEKKVAGILVEGRNIKEETDFVVIGIGINLVSNPKNVMFPAANLKEFGLEIKSLDLLKKFLDEFEKIYQDWLIFGFIKTRNLWLQRAYKLNEKISLKDDEKEISGIFKNIDETGNLILDIDGKEQKVFAADVLFG